MKLQCPNLKCLRDDKIQIVAYAWFDLKPDGTIRTPIIPAEKPIWHQHSGCRCDACGQVSKITNFIVSEKANVA